MLIAIASAIPPELALILDVFVAMLDVLRLIAFEKVVTLAALVAANVQAYLAQNPDVERTHVQNFKQELSDIGAKKPKLIAFGNVVYNILTRNLGNEFEIFRIRHYSHFMNRDIYRNEVLELCEQL